MTAPALSDRFLRLPDVIERTGLSSSTIRRREREGTFPAREAIGANCVAWRESAIAQWMAAPGDWQNAA